MIKLNGVEVKATIFPDHTSQVWGLPKVALEYDTDCHYIEWDFQSEAEFMHLAQLKWLLDYRGTFSRLYLPYLPYANQDKHVSNDTAFALHTFIELLNLLAFESVEILDTRSDLHKKIKNVVPLNGRQSE